MTDNNKNMDDGIYTLTDENGNEIQFELIGACEFKGAQYYAMIPAESDSDNDEFCEYIILKSVMENGEEMLVTIDDDEFDDVADYFDDILTQEIDYDAEAPADKK